MQQPIGFKKIVAVSIVENVLPTRAKKVFSKMPSEWKTSDFVSNFYNILSNSSSKKFSLKEIDALFLASVLHLHTQNKNSSTALDKLSNVFNGYTAPLGSVFFKMILENPSGLSEITPQSILPFEIEKERYAPFKVTIIFPTIRYIVQGEMLNLIRRRDILSGEETLVKLRTDLLNWAGEAGFSTEQTQKIKVGDFAQLAWRTLPNLPKENFSEIFLYAKFLTLLFFHDDIGDNQASLTSTLDSLSQKTEEIFFRNRDLSMIFESRPKTAIFSKFRRSEDPIIKIAVEIMDSFLDIKAQISNSDKFVNFEYLQRELKNYFTKTTEETKYLEKNIRIVETNYLANIRPYTSSLFACFAASAILQRIPIPDNLLYKEPICGLTFLGNELVSLPNDVISFPKEVEQKAYSLVQIKLIEKAIKKDLVLPETVFVDQKTIKIIAETNPELLLESITEVINQINGAMRCFAQQSTCVTEYAKKFLDDVVTPWIVGNGDWQNKSERYVRMLGLTGDHENSLKILETTHGYTVVKMD